LSVDSENRVQEFKSGLESDLASVESEIASHKSEIASHESEVARLGQQRDGIRQLIEELNRFLSGVKGEYGHSGTAVREALKAGHEAEAELPREIGSTASGSSKNLSRRQIVLRIIPGFEGRRFKSGDVRHTFVQDYLDGVEPPNFPQAINNLLKLMAKKGEIQDLGRDKSEHGGPRYYREIDNREDKLLSP
jgi:hypothetical protein